MGSKTDCCDSRIKQGTIQVRLSEMWNETAFNKSVFQRKVLKMIENVTKNSSYCCRTKYCGNVLPILVIAETFRILVIWPISEI